ncbi:glycosyltransferase [Neptunomonas phycophila]|uniref:glycosyltransferase n=1 Tax=Neptunomonas phycophila TaxID=1572645 RepID=UPI0030F548B5
MSSETIVKKAADSYKEGNYEAALNFYLRAANLYGESLFQVNIEMCKRKIRNNEASETESFLNKYFDHVYLVNLEHESTDRIKVVNQLRKSKIQHEIFTATNGYVGDPLERWKKYISKPLGSMSRYSNYNEREVARGKKFIESAGAIGYIYTYLRILRDAKKRGFKKVLILEDDIILSKNFENDFKKFVSCVSDDWKILQLGASQYGWSSFKLEDAARDGYYLPRNLETTGSFAIAFDLSIVDELIEVESSFEAPFDHLPMGEMYERYKGKCFVAYPNLVMPDVTDSSIRGGRCQYEHSKKVKWEIDNFVYPYPKPSIALVVSSKKNLKYYANFGKPKELGFDLRIYRTSSDGFRPVHHAEQVAEDYLFNFNVLTSEPIPEADFYGFVDSKTILTEEIIISFIEDQLKIKNEPGNKIQPFKANTTVPVSGKVSVIVPTYKRPENLLTAITSVLEQEYGDYEIFIINDNGEGSEYNSETDAVVESLKPLDPMGRIKYLKHTKNRNGAAARNTGIMRATGEYITFLDDDDMYLPNRLKDGVRALGKSNNRYGAAYCGFLGWNSPENNKSRYKQGDLTKELLLLDYTQHYLHTNTATYKNSAVFSLNGFDESYRRHQDLEFNLRFFELYEMLVTHNAGVRLNPSPSNISNKVFDASMLELKEKFLKQFETSIRCMPEHKAVYNAHWGEVLRYIKDESTLKNYLWNRLENGPLQVALKIEG